MTMRGTMPLAPRLVSTLARHAESLPFAEMPNCNLLTEQSLARTSAVGTTRKALGGATFATAILGIRGSLEPPSRRTMMDSGGSLDNVDPGKLRRSPCLPDVVLLGLRVARFAGSQSLSHPARRRRARRRQQRLV